MGNKNYHKQAIDILSKNDFVSGTRSLSDRLLLIEIAKSNPSALVKAFLKVENRLSVDPLKDLIIKLIRKSPNKISCIKELRSETKLSLKEAKEYIEKIQAEENLYPTVWIM